jgi:hemoglobin
MGPGAPEGKRARRNPGSDEMRASACLAVAYPTGRMSGIMDTARYAELSEEAVAAVVDAFYAKVRRDPALGPVFAAAIPDEAWPTHLAVIRDFWSSVLFKTGRYKGNPFTVHRSVEGISAPLFERWLTLFGETCREILAEAPAAELHDRAIAIAESLQAGLFFQPGAPLKED